MKIILLVLLGFCSVISSNSRLIEKITDRTSTTETKTGSSPPLRLARQAEGSREEDQLTGISKEDHVQSHEFSQSYDKRIRYFNKPKDNREFPRLSRHPRESNERVDRPVNNVTSPSASTVTVTYSRPKPKPELVKKPIPKYNEMDYDEDFQMKISKSPVKILDSGEHEDEDFNLDDYDFDVNHDEFIGRGKPLEPRTKHKETHEHHQSAKPEPKVAPEIKIKSKINIPTPSRASAKKGRSADNHKKVGEKEDYYDETGGSTKAPEKTRDLEDEFNEENEESKEYYSKLSSVRMARSLWKLNSAADKFGEKASGMSNGLSILPMFPQVPRNGQNEELSLASNDENDDVGQTD